MFEKIVTIRLPRFAFKVIFTLSTFALRCYLFPISHNEIGPLLYQTAVVVFSLMTDFWKEREDRRLFEEFYAYREGLTKFKTLIVSDLPTHILILSRDLKQILFKNDQLFKYIQLDHSDSLTEIQLLTHWLQHLSIDRDSLSEEAELAMAILRVKLGKSPSVLRFLQIFKTYQSQQDQLKYQFNAEYLESQGSTNIKKTMETKVFSMTWDGKEAIALILNDVTEHNQNLTLKVADVNKNKMLAMISHELRTPLNGILGVVSILKKELTEVRWLQYLAICKNSGELLLNLVNSILDLQHIRDNKFALKPTRDNLIELLTGIYDLFKFQFEQKNLYLELDICPDIPEYIVTDQNRLRQVLINLIGNALKFTFTGGVTISACQDPNKEGYVNFKVADTGPGIKEEDKKKLFKMYGRLDQPDPKLNTQGVGFGLEISDQLARLLAVDAEGGGIKLESQEGKGTTFYFSIKDIDMDEDCPSPGVRGLNYYEPRVFAEDIEDISVKISPYSAGGGIMNEKILIHKSSKMPDLNFQFQSDSESESHRFHVRSYRSEVSLQPDSQQLVVPNKLDKLREKIKNFRKQGFYSNLTKRKTDKSQLNQSISINSFLDNSAVKKKRDDIEEKRFKILLVDDNTFNLMVARTLLENLDYAVEVALNGKLAIEEVIKASGSARIDAILMDIQMPVMDGYEATKALKQMMKNREIPDIPIIAVSANDAEDDRKRSQEVGMYSHLSKPLNEVSLKEILEKVLIRNIISSGEEDEGKKDDEEEENGDSMMQKVD